MKKVILSMGLVLSLGMAQLSAQEISFGVKVDANTSNFLLTDMDDAESKLGFGASLGGFAKLEFGEYFAVQPELLFHFKTSVLESKSTNVSADYQYFGAEIPIYALGQFKVGNGKAFVGVGPTFGIGFDARYKYDNMDDIKLYDDIANSDQAYFQRFELGAGALIGYQFAENLQINATYKIGILNSLDAGKDDATMRNQSISLGIGYKF